MSRRGPAHALQPVDRARRQDGHGGARRDHLRLSRRARLRAEGRAVGARGRRLARASERSPTRCSTARCASTSARSRRRSPGAPAPSMSSPSTAASPIPPRSPIPASARAARGGARLYGPHPGAPIAGTPVDWVFIGSCTNSRLSRSARGRRRRAAAARSRPACAPGWCRARRRSSAQAEAEGLDRIFTDAGFEWREPGCSMCLAANGETVPPGPALGLHLEPQFRRPPGAAARAPIWRARPWRPRRRSPAPSPMCARWSAERCTKLHQALAAIAAPLLREQHRHRRDHPHRAAGRATTIAARSANGPSRRCATCPTGRRIPNSSSTASPIARGADPGRRPEFRLRLLARGAVWALQELGIRAIIGSELRRHLLQQLLPERPAAGRRSTRRRRGARRARSRQSQGAGRVSVDLEQPDVVAPVRRAPRLRDRSAPARRPARRAGRNRPDPAARRRDPRLPGTRPRGAPLDPCDVEQRHEQYRQPDQGRHCRRRGNRPGGDGAIASHPRLVRRHVAACRSSCARREYGVAPYLRTGKVLPPDTWRGDRGGRRHPVRRHRRSGNDGSARRGAQGRQPAAAAQQARPLRQPAPDVLRSGARRCGAAEGPRARGRRLRHRPRTHPRHLFRRAARHRDAARRPAPRLRHRKLHERRDRARRPRSPSSWRARGAASSARSTRPTCWSPASSGARWSPRCTRRNSPMSSSATSMSTTPPCSWCARRRSSTCW